MDYVVKIFDSVGVSDSSVSSTTFIVHLIDSVLALVGLK